MDKSGAFLIASMVLCGTVVVAYGAGVRRNPSPSMPMGLWLVRPVTAPLAHGDTVSVCLPDIPAKFGRERGYVSAGVCSNGSESLLKDVVAVPGDVVAASADAIIVNGRALPMSAGLPQDTANRPMPVMHAWTSVVDVGHVWLLGRNTKSYDSRYFGPVQDKNIIGKATPLLTFGGESDNVSN